MSDSFQSKEEKKDGKHKPNLRVVMPEISALVRPRKGLLAVGLVLMAINRVSGLVLPYSTRFLIDNVVTKHQMKLLGPIVGGVLTATLIQGVTSFTLTQLLSKAAQRLIADFRLKVQEHVGRLSVTYYDSNKTGTLVARIMSDVEGVRNLIGTGLVEFLGGLLTAHQILVVEAGRIVERGTHQSLYANGGRYFDLYNRQHGLEANLFLAPGEGDRLEPEGKEAGANGREATVDPLSVIRGSGT